MTVPAADPSSRVHSSIRGPSEQLEDGQPSKRPFGVYAITVLLLVQLAVGGYDMLRIERGSGAILLPEVGGRAFSLVADAVILALALTALMGLLLLRRWGWMALVIANGLSLMFAIWIYFRNGYLSLALFNGSLVVFYLNLRSVQTVFLRRDAVTGGGLGAQHYRAQGPGDSDLGSGGARTGTTSGGVP
jgi:hypothetical protein